LSSPYLRVNGRPSYSTGDPITIDAEKREITLDIPQSEIDARLAKWAAPAPRENRGVLAKYARQVCSASEGAVTDKF
jgi:dihydroxy-acid dehydratase